MSEYPTRTEIRKYVYEHGEFATVVADTTLDFDEMVERAVKAIAQNWGNIFVGKFNPSNNERVARVALRAALEEQEV